MPIKPENRHRYPLNWGEVRAEILKRANDRCERCGKPNRVYVTQTLHAWLDVTTGRWFGDDGKPVDPPLADETTTRVKVVLTIAHLDHVPEHCEPSNLRALCQRCHLRYDAEHHRLEAAKTRAKKRGSVGGDLPW